MFYLIFLIEISIITIFLVHNGAWQHLSLPASFFICLASLISARHTVLQGQCSISNSAATWAGCYIKKKWNKVHHSFQKISKWNSFRKVRGNEAECKCCRYTPRTSQHSSESWEASSRGREALSWSVDGSLWSVSWQMTATLITRL